MASTVPGVSTREAALAKVGIGVPTPDLSSLAAPTIPLTPLTPGRRTAPLRPLDAGRIDRVGTALPATGSGFAAALAKAIAARKASTDQNASRAAARPVQVEAPPRENAVRDVVRQLKQLVSAVREALAPKRQSGLSGSASSRQLGPDTPQADVAALNGVFARLVGMNAERNGKSGEDLSLSPQQDADVTALLQSVADSLAQATSPDGTIDEASLASALALDPLALAAAESLVAAAQAQGLIVPPDAQPAIDTTGDVVAGGDTVVRTGDQPGVAPVSSASPGNGGAAHLTAADKTVQVSVGATAAAGSGVVADSLSAGTSLEAVDPALVPPPVNDSVSAPVESAVTEVVLSAPTSVPVEGAAVGATVLAEAAAVVAAVEAAGGEAQTAAATAPAGTSSTEAPTAASRPLGLASSEAVAGTAEVALSDQSAAQPIVSTAATLVESDPALSAPVSLAAGAAASAVSEAADSVTAPTQSGAEATTVALPAARQSGVAQAASTGDAVGSAGDGAESVAPVGSGAIGNVGGASLPTSTSAAGTGASSLSGGTSSESASAGQAAAPSGQQTSGQATPGSAIAVPVGSANLSDAGAAAPAATDVTPEVDLHDQVAPVIVRQARLVSAGSSHELTVRLAPDHLGPLHVRISLIEGALTVGLTAANSDAQRALETALPQLRGALADSGLRLERLDVGVRDGGDNGGNGSNGSAGGQRGYGRGGDGQPGSEGPGGDRSAARQFDGRESGAPSFADVLFDQDGRAFGSASRSANRYGYRAYRRS